MRRNQKLAHMIMKSHARNLSTLAKTTPILADVTTVDDIECTRPTLESYIEALEKLFVIQDIEAWCPSIRSKATIQSRRYALIECKLGSREIEEGSKHLLEIKRLIQEHNKTEKQVPLRDPDLMIVMTGGSMAYTRPDGIKVIPLA